MIDTKAVVDYIADRIRELTPEMALDDAMAIVWEEAKAQFAEAGARESVTASREAASE